MGSGVGLSDEAERDASGASGVVCVPASRWKSSVGSEVMDSESSSVSAAAPDEG